MDLVFNLGVISADNNDVEQAKEYYQKVIDLDPTHINAQTNMAALILGEEKNIIEEMKKVDYAFVNATFFRVGELKRDMSKIPHPFTIETTTLFENESDKTKNKIYFIHFNHANLTLKVRHHLKDSIQNLGFHFAKEGDNFKL